MVELLDPDNVSATREWMLRQLSRSDEHLTVEELSDANNDVKNTQRVITAMMDAGLVDRRVRDTDGAGRNKLEYTITSKGDDLLERINDVSPEW